MKKLIALMLAVLMLCTFAACDNNSNPTTPSNTPTEGFAITYQGVKLVPGAAFDAASLPSVDNFENPNCAGEGKFITYMHDAFELTINVNGDKSVIYSIYMTDANTPTAEGLYMGDDVARISEIYGVGEPSADGDSIVFTKGATQLIVMVEAEAVSSIEYRMA